MQLAKLFVAAIASVLMASPVFAQNSDDAASSPPSAAASKKAAHKQNLQTEKAVRKALTGTHGLDSAGIVVLVRGGVVSLDGTVPDASQIELAQNAAQGAAGAKSVSSHLTVKEPGN